jgi:hypothetical protein
MLAREDLEHDNCRDCAVNASPQCQRAAPDYEVSSAVVASCDAFDRCRTIFERNCDRFGELPVTRRPMGVVKGDRTREYFHLNVGNPVQ